MSTYASTPTARGRDLLAQGVALGRVGVELRAGGGQGALRRFELRADLAELGGERTELLVARVLVAHEITVVKR